MTSDYRTEGETKIDASQAVSITANFYLEENLRSLDEIIGKGEGCFQRYYRPVVGLDLTGFTTGGEAHVSPLPFV